MIGKRFIGVLMAIMMAMMMVTVLCTEESKLSTLDIYSPTGEFGKIDLNDKSSVQNVVVVANSTQNAIGLFHNQFVSVNSLVGLGWLYYYVDLAPYTTVSITHATTSGSNNLEIYMDHISKPTIYSYTKKGFLKTYTNVLTSDFKYYSNRLYIAVRNANAYTSNGGFTLRVSITDRIEPKPTAPTYVYRADNSLTLALCIPTIVIALILLFAVIAQTKNIRVLTARVNDLERKLNASMQPPISEEMMPAMMNIPLMSSNSLQQDHEETQSVTVHQQQQQAMAQPPPTSYMIPQQQPITTPHLFHQFVQQQTLPPQFRNAQPYPFAYPQVVFAQPNVVQEQQVAQQQQTGQNQTKQ